MDTECQRSFTFNFVSSSVVLPVSVISFASFPNASLAWISIKEKEGQSNAAATHENGIRRQFVLPHVLPHSMPAETIPLITRDLTFTPYNVNWIPGSARLCAVGSTARGTGTIAVFHMEGKQLVLSNEVWIHTSRARALPTGLIIGAPL